MRYILHIWQSEGNLSRFNKRIGLITGLIPSKGAASGETTSNNGVFAADAGQSGTLQGESKPAPADFIRKSSAVVN